jgi:hypothetical protein
MITGTITYRILCNAYMDTDLSAVGPLAGSFAAKTVVEYVSKPFHELAHVAYCSFGATFPTMLSFPSLPSSSITCIWRPSIATFV